MSQVATGTILDRIVARTIADVEMRKAATPIGRLERRSESRPAPVSLRSALAGLDVGVIAEIKRASPSRGVFPVAIEPVAAASAYLDGGAAALSVLTDKPFFRGSLSDLEAAAAASHSRSAPAPVLRKDFILDPYQVVEALAHGADAILLIVAALDDRSLRSLLDLTMEVGLEALVEVHDETEVERAVSAGATTVGINNRDLRTFDVDLAVTERLAPLIPGGTVIVSESGIFHRDDLVRLRKVGINAVLVGESLIVAPDRAAAVRALLGRASP